MSRLKIAVIGATGNVGQLMIKLIPEYFGEGVELILAASENSVGNTINTHLGEIAACSIDQALTAKNN